MGSIAIIIIFVLFGVLTSLAKQKQQQARNQKREDQIDTNEYRGTYKEPSTYTPRSTAQTQSMKSRATVSANTSKYSSTSAYSNASSYATNKAAERAKDNMQEGELKTRPTAQEFRKMAGVEASDGDILSAAKMHSLATELSNEFDSHEDLMKPVYDLMVTGPNTSLPNTRDFLAEGMDMINAYTMTDENVLS